MSLSAIQDQAEEKAITALTCIDGRDPEAAHSLAEAALLEFISQSGFEDVVAAHEALVARCKWWSAG